MEILIHLDAASVGNTKNSNKHCHRSNSKVFGVHLASIAPGLVNVADSEDGYPVQSLVVDDLENFVVINLVMYVVNGVASVVHLVVLVWFVDESSSAVELHNTFFDLRIGPGQILVTSEIPPNGVNADGNTVISRDLVVVVGVRVVASIIFPLIVVIILTVVAIGGVSFMHWGHS